MSKYRVQILMSTYNGERFIEKQLDSIAKQDHEVSLLIRDDGSTDSTLDIIRRYETKYNWITHIESENIGVIHSFFELVRMADRDADYYAFADQDDIWFRNKVSEAVGIISGMTDRQPALYCAAQTLIDAEDNVMDVKMLDVHLRPGFGNAIVENLATGCTCMINRAMLDKLASYEPEYTIMHDWWMYLIAEAMGELYYDTRPMMYYRQHGNNTMGSRTNYIEEFRERFRRFSGNKGKLYRQMAAFNKAYALEDDNADILNMVMSYNKSMGARLRCIFSRKIYRQRKLDNLIFKLLFLMNHI